MFGWFREAGKRNGRYQFVSGAPDVHAVYGWFQVGDILSLGAVPNKSRFPAWASYHPHFYGVRGANNSLYVASDELKLGGIESGIPGAGRLTQFSAQVRLTAPNSAQRSLWQLPVWFDPARSPEPLSYHRNPERWRNGGDGVLLRAAGRGQEFVFDTDVYPEANEWIKSLCSR